MGRVPRMNKVEKIDYFIRSSSKLTVVYLYSQKSIKRGHTFEGQSENPQVIQAAGLEDRAGTESTHGQDRPSSHKIQGHLIWIICPWVLKKYLKRHLAFQ